jgi:threonine dehydrogenase-like Zn-dependent dehydrogenase
VLVAPVPLLARCFAEWQVVPGRSLVKLPDGADLDRLLMAQQLGTTVYAMRRFWPETVAGPAAGLTAAICGAGSAGLFFAQLTRRAGFSTVVIASSGRSSRRCWRRPAVWARTW